MVGGINFKKDPFLSLVNVILYLVLIIVIYFLLLKVTGHSPVFEAIMITIVIGLILNSFRYEFVLGKFIGENNEFKKSIRQSFDHIKRDFREIKEDVKSLKK